MQLITLLISMTLSLSATIALASVEHYFSNIKNDPSQLYLFFKTMPKGGDLHYHLDGGAPPETMLSLVSHGHYCLDTHSYIIREANQINNESNCDTQLFNQLHKNSPLYKEVIDSWSMKNFTPGSESGHDHFFATFNKFIPIVSKFGSELLAEVMIRAANQHELYLEVMVIPDDAHSANFGKLIEKATTLPDKKQILLNSQKFQNNINLTVSKNAYLLNKTQQQLGCDSENPSPGCTITTKFQYVILREQALNNFFAQALNGFAAVSQSKTLVSINLVQAEDGVISLNDYHRQMNILNFLHHAYPNVHITLHAGELISGNIGSREVPTKELRYHIHDALFTGHAERIGHGVDINHEKNSDEILNHMLKHNIPVEINLTSNQKILNVSGETHPIKNYLAHQVPVILSTDDEGILRTNLSREYVNAVIQQDLDYATLKTINRNALTYSFLSGKSIWKNSREGIFVPECKKLYSASCKRFIAQSQKASLQWELENQLLRFEGQYNH